MPLIVDYADVLQRMSGEGFRCNYHHSGAFGFGPGAQVLIRGWIGPDDATIRPGLLPSIRRISPPFAPHLAEALLRAWQTSLRGVAWLMPMSHWHFELHDGSRDWLPDRLEEIGVDPAALRDRADGSALQFALDESPALSTVIIALLENLKVSDFQLAFPGRPALCMIHHHTQLWWQTTDAKLIRHIDAALPAAFTGTAQ
ncbi:MAG: hypothetical protein ABSH22_13705 [Tepidisphaeraceae bacterium]|jgi:hypothetical protein